MKKIKLLKFAVIFMSIGIIFQCQKNPIPYDLDDSNLIIDTLTIKAITGGTYLSPPLMGSTDGLYFGSKNGNDALFSLLRYRNLSYTNSIYTYNLLDSDVTMDSLVFTFTALDSNLLVNNQALSNTIFELYYFPESGDSVFSEDESNYLNISEANVQNSVLVGQGHFVESEPDSDEVTYPILSIKADNMDDILNFLADTNDTENRTFLLKNIDPIDNIIAIRSRESSNYPILTAYYQVSDDTSQSIFYPLEDITIVKPREITEDDQNYITVSRAAGLKSILQFDLSNIPFDSTSMVFKIAELYINSTSLDSLSDLEIIGTALVDSIDVTDYWELVEDDLTIEEDIEMTGNFEYNQLEMKIRDFLEGYMTGTYNNYGLKIYVSSTSDPFETIHFIVDEENETLNPYIKITYVKL